MGLNKKTYWIDIIRKQVMKFKGFWKQKKKQ